MKGADRLLYGIESWAGVAVERDAAEETLLAAAFGRVAAATRTRQETVRRRAVLPGLGLFRERPHLLYDPVATIAPQARTEVLAPTAVEPRPEDFEPLRNALAEALGGSVPQESDLLALLHCVAWALPDSMSDRLEGDRDSVTLPAFQQLVAAAASVIEKTPASTMTWRLVVGKVVVEDAGTYWRGGAPRSWLARRAEVVEAAVARIVESLGLARSCVLHCRLGDLALLAPDVPETCEVLAAARRDANLELFSRWRGEAWMLMDSWSFDPEELARLAPLLFACRERLLAAPGAHLASLLDSLPEKEEEGEVEDLGSAICDLQGERRELGSSKEALLPAAPQYQDVEATDRDIRIPQVEDRKPPAALLRVRIKDLLPLVACSRGPRRDAGHLIEALGRVDVFCELMIGELAAQDRTGRCSYLRVEGDLLVGVGPWQALIDAALRVHERFSALVGANENLNLGGALVRVEEGDLAAAALAASSGEGRARERGSGSIWIEARSLRWEGQGAASLAGVVEFARRMVAATGKGRTRASFYASLQRIGELFRGGADDWGPRLLSLIGSRMRGRRGGDPPFRELAAELDGPTDLMANLDLAARWAALVVMERK